MGHPDHFFIYFRLFQRILKFLKQINVKNAHSVSSIWDSNQRPSEHESPPITTRPGLPP